RRGGIWQREWAEGLLAVGDNLKALDLGTRPHRPRLEADRGQRIGLAEVDLDPGLVAVAVRRPFGDGVAVDGVVTAEGRVHGTAAVVAAGAGDLRAQRQQSDVLARRQRCRWRRDGRVERVVVADIERAIRPDALQPHLVLRV